MPAEIWKPFPEEFTLLGDFAHIVEQLGANSTDDVAWSLVDEEVDGVPGHKLEGVLK